jgi:two-component system KDP operon response regulator KdpE
MNKTKVLVIDDEPQIRKLLQINLESHDYQVIQASSGKEGLQLAASFAPELIILDLGLPDQNGQEILKILREWYSAPIFILTVQDKESDIVEALDNGATDYLTKPFRTGELLARIRGAIRRNQNSVNTAPLSFEDLEVDLQARLVRKNGAIVKLTSTEYQLLTLFAKNEGKVLTHNYLLKEVWGYSYQSETQYLRVFVAALRKKIEDNPNSPKHLFTENGVGYRFE